MIVYNNQVFSEDPLHKFHLEDFHKNDDVIIHLGYNPSNLIKKNQNEKHILIELEQPNRFLHPVTHDSTFICEKFFNKILTINPEFVKNRNEKLGVELYTYVFFPYSLRYVSTDSFKTNDVIYTGNRDYYNICNKINNRSLIWVGRGGNISNISYLEKINYTKNSKISISHNIVEFKDLIPFMDTQKDTVSHIDGIFEQHKARTIEAAFNKSIIVHINTGQKLIEDFFKEGEDFLYYREGLIDDILNNYDSYKFLSENAFNKSINNYTTEHFYNKYIKPLL
jgi:hypothetical protein